MDKTKLLELIANGESEQVEFKKSFNDEAIETLGAFANASGGYLIIGISDDGDICGFKDGKRTLEDMANRIQQAADPRIQPSISVHNLNKKNLCILHIEEAISSPVSIRGRFFKRTGRTNQRMSHEEIMGCITKNVGISWDSIAVMEASVDDLDISLMENIIQSSKQISRQSIPENTTVNSFLKKLGLLKNNYPTRAAILLFGKSPENFFPSAFLKLGRFRSPTLIVDDKEVHGPLVKQLDECLTWFRERLTTEFIITDEAERTVKWEYPLNAIREALVNLLCHRDYNQGTHSQIRLYDDRLEFWNSGALPSSLSTDNLLEEHDSIPRNRKIAEIFFMLGFIERWGSGTLRIAEALHHLSYPTPEFQSNHNAFKLIMKKHLSQAELSDRQALIVDYIKQHGSISNTELQDIAKISKRTATRELNELLASDRIISESTSSRGRGIRYTLKKL